MEDEERKDRAERFLERLEMLSDIADGYAFEIEQGLKMLGASTVSAFVRDAAYACNTLGEIAGNVMSGARVRLPKPEKEEEPGEPPEGQDQPGVIRFPGPAAAGGGS